MESNDNAQKTKDSMKAQISEKIPKLIERAQIHFEKLQQPRYISVESIDAQFKTIHMVEEVEMLEKESQRLVEKSRKYEVYQRTLEMDPNPFREVDDMHT